MDSAPGDEMKFSSLLLTISSVGVALLLTACSQVLDLDSYSDRPAADDGQGSSSGCVQGNCTFVCPKGVTCDEECTGGNCTFLCAEGSTCNDSCTGGNCTLSCSVGATCNASCTGGNCEFQCPQGATCNTTCVGQGCKTQQ